MNELTEGEKETVARAFKLRIELMGQVARSSNGEARTRAQQEIERLVSVAKKLQLP